MVCRYYLLMQKLLAGAHNPELREELLLLG